jgi:nicotinamidase/pyrazinamidase
VVYSQDWHPESTPHFAKDGGIWPVHCVMDTWGAELYPRLDVGGPVVRKGSAGEDGYSAFSMRDPLSGATTPTKLQSLLIPTIRRLVIVGLAGDYCVKQTAMDGRRLGYDVVIPLRHTRFVNLSRGDDERAAASMRDAGAELI